MDKLDNLCNYVELEYDNDRFCKFCIIDSTRCNAYKKLSLYGIHLQVLELSFIEGSTEFYKVYCIIPKNSKETFKKAMEEAKDIEWNIHGLVYAGMLISQLED